MALNIDKLAKLTGHTPLTIREGIKQGLLPVGAAIKTKENASRYTYVLYDAKVKEYFGLTDEDIENCKIGGKS